MNVSRIFVTTASALSVLALIGCSSTRSAPEVEPAPVVVQAAPPEPVVFIEATPPQPVVVQSDRTAEVVVRNDAPVMVAQEPVTSMPASEFAERPPQADRN